MRKWMILYRERVYHVDEDTRIQTKVYASDAYPEWAVVINWLDMDSHKPNEILAISEIC